jgi:hypothetical protein
MLVTPHEPIDPADPASMCTPDCRRCAEMVADEEEAIENGLLDYAGSLGGIGADTGELKRRIVKIERVLDQIRPGWRHRP